MQETVCSRASSVGIPTAPDAKKVREINDLLLDIIGRRKGWKMFNLIGIGEHAGSGVPDIFDIWKNEGLKEP
jgi:predicted HTH transcriptional regulator